MKSIRLPSGATYYAHEHNALRSDAAAAAFLHVHQQLGALALGTAPTNGQTVTLDINGTNVVFTAVTGSPTNPGDVKAPGTAAGFVANLFAGFQNPTVSTSTFIALSAANAQLVQYLGWALPSGGTTITPFSLNTSTYAPLTSFSATTTVTSGSWTAQLMQLYVQPGSYYVGTTRILFLGTSTPTFTAPSSHPRIDLVTADSSGTIALVTGTENASPVAPSYPVNKLVLAEIMHVVGETALYDNDNQQSGQGYIYNDVRPALAPPYISSTGQVASGLFVPDPGSDAQGDILYYNGSAFARLPAGTNGYVLQTQGAGANPRWMLSSMTHIIADASQPTFTNTLNATFETIASYPSIQALVAGQTIWLRGIVLSTLVVGSQTIKLRVQMNGTTMVEIDVPTAGASGTFYFEAMILVPTPASQQYANIIINAPVSGALSVSNSSLAANLSSPFTLTVQGYASTGASNASEWAIQSLTMFILN